MSREVTGKSSREIAALAPSRQQYAKVRYNGNAFGGFNMSDSDFPRKSNLNERKQ